MRGIGAVVLLSVELPVGERGYHLSGGRLVLGVGLGGPPEREYETFCEVGDPRLRAEKLDEGLDVLTGLWGGEPFTYYSFSNETAYRHWRIYVTAHMGGSDLGIVEIEMMENLAE